MLRGTDLRLADMRNADLRGAVFGLSLADELANAKKCHAKFRAREKRDGSIQSAMDNILHRIDSTSTCLSGPGVMARVEKSAANLRGANLGGAQLDGADFTGAKGCDEVVNAPSNFSSRCTNPNVRPPSPVKIDGVESGNLREVLGRELFANTADENVWTDLHFAAAMDLPELVKLLSKTGDDLAARTNDDGKPMGPSLRDSLSALGLSYPLRKGDTPLHVAAQYDAENAAKALVSLGADVNAKTGRRSDITSLCCHQK